MRDDLNPIDVHVGKRLRFGRTMHGMSQEAIGTAIGVTFQQIQKYECGVNCIRSSRLYDLSKTLRVPITFFFEGFQEDGKGNAYGIPGASDSGKSGFDMSDIQSSREAIELMRAFHKIQEPHLRSRVLDLVRAMSDNKTMY